MKNHIINIQSISFIKYFHFLSLVHYNEFTLFQINKKTNQFFIINPMLYSKFFDKTIRGLKIRQLASMSIS
jgi:hypothetical protein